MKRNALRCRIYHSLIILGASLAWLQSQAKPLQIVHTNDLHSHLETGDSPDTGGYAAVKAKMDEIRLKAAEQGIETVVLDAGDFSEGTPFFLADEGKQSWRTMDSMGYDAVALGNHDWLIGTAQLDGILGSLMPHTPFLSANLKVSDSYRNVNRYIQPYTEVTRGGLRIAVMGLSTDEFVYRWRVQDGDVNAPVDRANELLPELRARNDLVIALTHLGTSADIDLVQKTEGVDLVVGGHSHTKLTSPLLPKDLRGFPVPVVQTGQHGDFVGDLLIDVEPGQPVQVLRYQLLPVKTAQAQNRTIAGMVSDARAQLEQRYGPSWLYEVIGQSDSPLERPLEHPTLWGDIGAQAIQEAAGADCSLDVGEFYGNTMPAGPITREALMQLYPRVFDVHKPMGWNVWKVKVPGWLLQLVLGIVTENGQYLNTSGITYEVEDVDGRPQLKNMKVRGKWVNPFKSYKVAVSEGIGRGTLEISFLLAAFFQPVDTGIPIWSAMEQKLNRMGGVIRSDKSGLP